MSALSLVNLLLRHRWMILGVELALLVIVGAVIVIRGPSYTSGATFLPQTGSGGAQLDRLAGLATQLGVNVRTPEPGQSPQFYVELLESRALLRSAVTSSYPVPVADGDSSRTGDLIALLEIEEASRERAVAEGMERLEEATSAEVGSESGLVEFSVTLPSPALAHGVAERLLELVNEFNVNVRQSQAQEEREFVEDRLEEARRELEQAEAELEGFLENNRRYENSPRLRFEYQRLEREVELRQQVVTSLAQSLEEARIEAVRSTPVTSVVSPPEWPVEPDSRHLLRNGFLVLFLGGVLSAGLAIVCEYGRTAAKEENEEYREFQELKRQTARDLASFWGRVKRRLGRADS